MNDYRKILTILKDLLYKSGNSHWGKWIEEDIYEWDNYKSTKHHKSAFGGMNSINDLYVGEYGKIGAWENNLFDYLKSMSYSFVIRKKIQLQPQEANVIHGVICRNCEYSEINEYNIENHISNKHLPAFITELLPTEEYFSLINIEKLANQTEIVSERNLLINSLKEFKINFSKSTIWLNNCPKCESNDMCVYRWNIIEIDSKITLARSKDNISIKAKRSWWKKLIGYS